VCFFFVAFPFVMLENGLELVCIAIWLHLSHHDFVLASLKCRMPFFYRMSVGWMPSDNILILYHVVLKSITWVVGMGRTWSGCICTKAHRSDKPPPSGTWYNSMGISGLKLGSELHISKAMIMLTSIVQVSLQVSSNFQGLWPD
jgi:hypothetical protein